MQPGWSTLANFQQCSDFVEGASDGLTLTLGEGPVMDH